jgi:hypothetical protein
MDYFSNTTLQTFIREMQSSENALSKIKRILENHFSAFSETPALAEVIFNEEIFHNDPLHTQRIKQINEAQAQSKSIYSSVLNFSTIRTLHKNHAFHRKHCNHKLPKALKIVLLPTQKIHYAKNSAVSSIGRNAAFLLHVKKSHNKIRSR